MKKLLKLYELGTKFANLPFRRLQSLETYLNQNDRKRCNNLAGNTIRT